MTFADGPTTHRDLLAERFGEELVPLETDGDRDEFADVIDGARRTRFLAALRALVVWFTDHPTVPVPHLVTFHATVADLPALYATAEHLGVRVYGEERPQCDLDLMRNPLAAQILVATPPNDRKPL